MLNRVAKAIAGDRGRLASFVDEWPYVAAIAVFLASRLVVALALATADWVVPKAIGPGFWERPDAAFSKLLRWDAGWYLAIVEVGYSAPSAAGHQSTLAFFPLYPLLAGWIDRATGLGAPESLLLVSNLSALALAPVMVALVAPRYGARVAVTAVTIAFLTPTSFFLSSTYTESLALLLCLGALLALRERGYWLAALLAGLATASRSVAVALAPIIVLRFWIVERPGISRALVGGASLGLIAVAGLLAFMVFMAAQFGDQAAFASAQSAWAGHGGFVDRAARALSLAPLLTPNLGLPFMVTTIALLVAGARRMDWTLTAFGTLVLAIPYLTLAGGDAGLSSMPRFVLMAFPAALAAAIFLEGRPKITIALLVASTIGLYVATAMFAQWHWVA